MLVKLRNVTVTNVKCYDLNRQQNSMQFGSTVLLLTMWSVSPKCLENCISIFSTAFYVWLSVEDTRKITPVLNLTSKLY